MPLSANNSAGCLNSRRVVCWSTARLRSRSQSPCSDFPSRRFARASLPLMKPLSVWFYAIGLSLWLSLCFGAAAIVVNMNIREAENNLIRYGDAYSDHLNKGMVGREAIL